MSYFFQLIAVSLGHRECLSETPTPAEWDELFKAACRQTLGGVLYAAIERLPAGQRPPRQVLLAWYALAQQVRSLNARLNAEAGNVVRRLAADGFRAVLLKGQGVAQLYPDPSLRQPGDIDLWLEGSRDAIVAYVRRMDPRCNVVYLHVDFPILPQTDVEVHFWPAWFSNPLRNVRLRRYFRRSFETQYRHRLALSPDGEPVSVPTAAFNQFYLLLHIYRHQVGDEGIGLRQLMDYYYALQAGVDAGLERMLRRFGLYRFARAVAWVLQTVFGADDAYLPAPPDERRGRVLLRDIMEAGNFGQYKPRAARADTRLRRFGRGVQRGLRFLNAYPDEVLWNPVFKLWHYSWRKAKGYL